MKQPIRIIILLLFCFGPGAIAQDVGDAPNPQDPVEETVTEVENAQNDLAENVAAEEEVAEQEVIAAVEAATEEAEPEILYEAVEEEEPSIDYRGELVTISNNSRLERNERVDDMVTIMGNSVSLGYVDGDMVTVLGNSELDGYVDGDFVVVLGSADFGPQAEVDGDVVVIGGSMNVHPDSKVDGETVSIPFFSADMMDHFQEVPLFVRECIFLARPISPEVKFTFYVAGVFLLFYLLLAALFPRQMERSRNAIEEKTFQSFLAGILVLALHIPFMVILAITVVGIPLIPLVDLAILAIATFGKGVVLFFIGKQIARAVRLSAFEQPILAILIGGVIIYALYMIPFFGLFLWLLFTTLGLGAVCIAIGDSISERKAVRQAAQPTSNTALPPPLSGTISQTAEPGTPLSQINPATAAIFQRVGFWWRTLATLIDLILVGLITGILNIGTPLVPLFAYFIIFWGWKGSTLGGMALGLRVQKLSGESLDWSTAIIRSLSSIVSFLPLLLGFFWAGWDPENQSWHDKISGTTVVQIPKGYTWS